MNGGGGRLFLLDLEYGGSALALGAGEGLIEGSKCFISKGVTRKSLAVLCIS